MILPHQESQAIKTIAMWLAERDGVFQGGIGGGDWNLNPHFEEYTKEAEELADLINLATCNKSPMGLKQFSRSMG